MKTVLSILFVVAIAAWVSIGGGACEEYIPPPTPVLEGLSSGVLTDSRAPLVIDFGTPIDDTTLFVKVALYETDVEGNLYDEDDDPNTEIHVIARRDPIDGDLAVHASLENGNATLRLSLDSALPVGPKLVLLVEGGLKSTANGHVSHNRIRIPFSYVVQCAKGSASKFPSGNYFVLLDVDKPLGTQIQLLAYIDVDAATGALTGQFTNADRSTTQTCPTACPSSDVCRLLPAPECVAPSTRAGTVDEWPDFVPNAPPPVGYSFEVQGCAVDNGVATGILTAPATMVVESPQVTVEGLTMTASFTPGSDGVIRATGSLVADVVRLGTSPLGPGKGSMTAVKIPDDRAPANIPHPPPINNDGGN